MAATTLRFDMAVPATPALVGLHAFLQALCHAPGANRYGFVVSNGLDWRIVAP